MKEIKEIKFRFFRTKAKEMVYGFKGCSLTYVLDMWENEKHVSEPMQYTGLKDKNGKEIYEGDVLKLRNEVIGAVYWSDYFAMWAVNGGALMRNTDGEVIGNIYETPELLEVKS